MTLYSAAPPVRTFQQDKPTLLVCWWVTLFAAAIILFRVVGRYVRTERLFREDKLAFACLIPLFIRMAFVHVVLLYGTNNVQVDGLSELSIHDRAIGSRLVLASRLSYAGILWMLKFTITEFLKRLTFQIWRRSYEVTLRCIRWFLLLTFIAILLSDLVECQHFTHYWQVRPDPGAQCRQGYAVFLTTAICNILTDLLLVIFPIPIILKSSMPLKRKFNLVCLFALSIIPVAVTFYQIPEIINKKGRQQTRSLWASIEILAATAVANALVLGSFVRDRGVKKQKWKAGSVSGNLERSISLQGTVARAWGSDEDLVRDLGLGVGQELRHHSHVPSIPRPAPMATSGNEDIRYLQNPSRTPSNSEAQDTSSEDYDLFKIERQQSRDDHGEKGPELSSMITPRKLSFFDVGGLLESEELHNHPQRAANEAYTTFSNPFIQHQRSFSQPSQPQAFPYPTVLSPAPLLRSPNPQGDFRKGSEALLQDLGGLITPLHSVFSPLIPPDPNLPPLPSPSHTHSPLYPTSHSNTVRPILTTSQSATTANWNQSPFSFTSPGRSHSLDPFDDAIPMRPIRSDKSTSDNENLRDVGGLLSSNI